MTILLLITALWLGDVNSTVKPEEVKRAVEGYVRNQCVGLPQTVVVEFRSLPNEIPVSETSHALRVAPEGSPRLSGNVSVPVEVVVKDNVVRRLLVPIKVRTFANVLVASRQLMQHALVTNNVVEMQMLETTLLPQDIITSFDGLKGKRTSRIISQGSVLRESIMESIPLVQQDETVTLIVKAKGVEVSTKVIAKENGREGDQILVQNLETREKLKAKVVTNKIVQLDIDERSKNPR